MGVITRSNSHLEQVIIGALGDRVPNRRHILEIKGMNLLVDWMQQNGLNREDISGLSSQVACDVISLLLLAITTKFVVAFY